MTTLALFAMLFAFLILGLPVAIALGLSAITTIFFFSNDTLASVALKLFEALSEHYTLLAIPFFILSSAFLSSGGIARRLIRFATGVSAARMFAAGLIPGLVMGLMLMLAIYVWAHIKGYPRQPWAGFGELSDSGVRAVGGLMLIVIVLARFTAASPARPRPRRFRRSTLFSSPS